MAIITHEMENEQRVSSRIRSFFKRYQIGELLHRCNAYKHSGIPVVSIVIYLFCLVFRNRSMYLDMTSDRKSCDFKQDTVYRLKNAAHIHWLRFTTLLAAKIIKETLQPLTSEERDDVLIVDDSVFERPRSKKVELLAWIFDHAHHRTVRGFQMLSLGWSDGATFLPVNSCLVSTANAEKRINEAKTMTANSIGAQRRRLAQEEKPDIVPKLIKEALSADISAKYVLFDSWYCIPKVIHAVQQMGLNVVAMAKRSNKKYVFNAQRLNCKEIFARSKKRRGRSRYLLSVNAQLPYQPDKESEEILIPVKLVFVRNKNKRNEYLVLLSTDLSLSEEDVIRIYSKRWDIEVFFKTCKSVLRLTDECRSMSYDAMCAQTAIVFARYMLLAVEARQEKDIRTAGPLFCAICDEIADVTFGQAFGILQQIWTNLLRDLNLPEERITALFTQLCRDLPKDVAKLLGVWVESATAACVLGCEV
jgi:hypothetical protein